MDSWLTFGFLAWAVALLVFTLRRSVALRKALAARREDQVRLEALFKSGPLPTWVLDQDTLQFLEVNEAALRQYGYTRDEFHALTARDIRVPEEWPLLERSANTGRSDLPMQRGRHRRKDGTLLNVEIHARQVTYKARPARLVILEDITARLGAERALQESEAQFRAMSEASPAGIAMMTPDGGVRYVNDAALRMLGLSRERAMGSGWLDGFHADDRERVRMQWTAAAAACTSYTAAGRFAREDFWWRIRTAPVWSDGTCTGHVAVIVDETEQRSANEAVREGEERFRQLAEHLPAVVYLVDPRMGSVLFISPAYEKIWGRTSRSLYASPWSFLDAVHDDDRERVQHAYQRRLTRLSIEYRIVRPNGDVVWIEDMQFPIRRADGKIYLVAGLAFDVTRRRRLETQLIESQKMESLGRLAGGVAHDFNNLLTVIFSHTDLLKETAAADQRIVSGLNEIDNAAQRASALTRQLLTFAQRQVVEPQVLDLNQTIANLEPLIRHMAGNKIDVVVHPGATTSTARFDPNQIDQVVMNLAANARDAMPDGGSLRVETATVSGPIAGTGVPAGQYVSVTVADTGAGVPAEIRPYVFDPFFTTKPTGQGIGLGLSTAFGIVSQFNGYLELSSRVGLGTELTCYFPVALPDPSVPVQALPTAGAALNTETILIVEDEPEVRKVAQATLERLGYKIFAAPNGIEALTVAQSLGDSLDLVVTDVVMPEMGGWEMAERLRAWRPTLKILFTSGYNEEIANAAGSVAAGVHFLPKPYMPSALTQRVRQLLDA